MFELDVLGIGAWSARFGHWADLVEGLRNDRWKAETRLQPQRVAPRDRRRMPRPVRMAVEVMDQACSMASGRPAPLATVFSSAMGDMDITDYMCRVLATAPGEISPTRFHNSVHNAAPGYWSIATQSHAPASAVSAYQHTAPMAFLEAAIQSIEEEIAVLLVTQELSAPAALRDTCSTDVDFAAALLLAPSGQHGSSVARLTCEVRQVASAWPALPEALAEHLAGHPGARLLPLLAAIASPVPDGGSSAFAFPLSAGCSLQIVTSGGQLG